MAEMATGGHTALWMRLKKLEVELDQIHSASAARSRTTLPSSSIRTPAR
jgi:hypothetical protein